MKLHGESDRVDENEDKDNVFKGLRSHEPPNLVLQPVLGNIPSDGLRLEGKFNTVSLQNLENCHCRGRRVPKERNWRSPGFYPARSSCTLALPRFET